MRQAQGLCTCSDSSIRRPGNGAQVDVCKLMQTFPRGMSACVRESFARMDVMDPLLRSRLSRWLAYHLSNFDFMWPWDKWKHVLTAPAHDSQRCRAPASIHKRVLLQSCCG